QRFSEYLSVLARLSALACGVALKHPAWLHHRRIGSGLSLSAISLSYFFADLVRAVCFRTGASVPAAAASLARRSARSRAVLTRVASSCSMYSFQAAAPAFACSSLRKSLLALRTAALSCSAILGSPSKSPKTCPEKCPQCACSSVRLLT